MRNTKPFGDVILLLFILLGLYSFMISNGKFCMLTAVCVGTCYEAKILSNCYPNKTKMKYNLLRSKYFVVCAYCTLGLSINYNSEILVESCRQFITSYTYFHIKIF